MRSTVEIKKETRERLKGYGKKGETYDKLLNRLLDDVDRGRVNRG